MKELFSKLDAIAINLEQGDMLVVNIVLAFVMFGVALGIKMQTFKDIFRNPKSVLLGMVLQWVGLPAITFLITLLLNPLITPMIAIGMILVASCPGGNVSNFISSLSKGNIELSVSMTAITTAAAPLITPINFLIWGTLYTRFAAVKSDIPTLEIPFSDMLMQILLILGLPIVLGMLVSYYRPRWAEILKKPLQVVSIVFFIGMVAVLLYKVLGTLHEQHLLDSAGVGILAVLALVVVHNASAFATGYFGAKLLRLPELDRRSMTIEVGIQNSGLGLAMLLNPRIFPPAEWGPSPEATGVCGGLILVAALWGVWHIVAGLSIASVFRRQDRKQ